MRSRESGDGEDDASVATAVYDGYQPLSVESFISKTEDGRFDTLNVSVLVPDLEVDADGTLLLRSAKRMQQLNALRDAENERIGIEESFATRRRLALKRKAEQDLLEAQLRAALPFREMLAEAERNAAAVKAKASLDVSAASASADG